MIYLEDFNPELVKIKYKFERIGLGLYELNPKLVIPLIWDFMCADVYFFHALH
jgi:hypothetical protein